MSDTDKLAAEVASNAAREVAALLGVKLDGRMVAGVATLLVEAVRGKTWEEAHAAGKAAADAIKTDADAEDFWRTR